MAATSPSLGGSESRVSHALSACAGLPQALTLRSLTGLGCCTCSPNPLRGWTNTPVLLFSRGYRYSPVSIDLIRADTRALSRFLGPLPLNLHISIWSRSHTYALLLPLSLTRWPRGVEMPSLPSHACPFFGPRLPSIRFLGRSALLSPAECHDYHQTLFKGADGQMPSNILRLSLLGGPP